MAAKDADEWLPHHPPDSPQHPSRAQIHRKGALDSPRPQVPAEVKHGEDPQDSDSAGLGNHNIGVAQQNQLTLEDGDSRLAFADGPLADPQVVQTHVQGTDSPGRCSAVEKHGVGELVAHVDVSRNLETSKKDIKIPDPDLK